MRAAVTRGPSAMELADVPEPGPPGPGELLVRPEAVGLCGSDFHYFLGHLPGVAYPRVQGHEFSAVIEASGPGCPAELAPGARVAVWPVQGCGSCYPCRLGRENVCTRLRLIGIHGDGALQELLTIPATQAFPVEGDARLAAFVEPMSIAVHAVARGRVAAGERVLVLGAGPIGQAVAIAALDLGASVLLVDRVLERLEHAESYGAEIAYLAPDEDIVRIAHRWADEGPEVVFEATGASDPTRAAVDAVATAGRVVIVGLSDHDMPLRVGALPFRELDVLGASTCTAADFAAAADLVQRRRDAVEPLLTHDFELAEAPAAISYAIAHPEEVIKAVVHIGAQA